MTGFTGDEMLSRSFTKLLYPDDRASVEERGEKRARGEPVPDKVEFRSFVKMEKYVVETRAAAIQCRETGYSALISDITERKKTGGRIT